MHLFSHGKLKKMFLNLYTYFIFDERVPALAWYQSINLTEICHQKNISTTLSLTYSVIFKIFLKEYISIWLFQVEKVFCSNKYWCEFYEKPIYTIPFLIIIIFLVISFSLCFYLKSKYRFNSNNQRFDNNYEYTRLNNSSFELGINTESNYVHINMYLLIDFYPSSKYEFNNK